MPFRITMRSADVQEALNSQGYTTGRAGTLDNLDTSISSRAAPGAAMDLNAGAETKVKSQAGGAMDDRGFTSGRGSNLDKLDADISTRAAPADILTNPANKVDGARIDADISSRAAPGDSMDIVAAARAAIWNELIPGTPTSGSFGEQVKDNLDTSVGSRAAPGAAMDLNAGAETKVKSQAGGAMDDRGFTSGRGPNLDKLDTNVSTRAAPGDILANAAEKVDGAKIDASISTRATTDEVDAKMSDRGLTTARMAKLDNVSAPASASDSVAAGSNTSGLTVQLDTGYRSVVEIRYSCGAAADLYVEGSDDGSTWYEGDSFSEGGAVTDKVAGYLSARKHIRIRSTTTGIDLSFEVVALL